MAIADLIEAVERGEWVSNWRDAAKALGGIHPDDRHIKAARAFHGDLNAAAALLEAVLPGWRLDDMHEKVWPGRFGAAIAVRPDGKTVSADAGNPARALLLATLKALAAKETTDG